MSLSKFQVVLFEAQASFGPSSPKYRTYLPFFSRCRRNKEINKMGSYRRSLDIDSFMECESIAASTEEILWSDDDTIVADQELIWQAGRIFFLTKNHIVQRMQHQNVPLATLINYAINLYMIYCARKNVQQSN